MRTHFLPLGCLLLFGVTSNYSAGQDPPKDREVSSAHSILREASDLALNQGPQERFWTDQVLLRIGEQQTRAGDFEGALRSLRGSNYDHGRDSGLKRLVEALARAGNKDRALEVSRLIEPGSGRTRDKMQQVVQVHWLEHLIAKGDLQQARKAVEQIPSPQEHHEALRKLAVAWSRSGEAVQAGKYFTEAIEAAKAIKSDFVRSQALLQTGDAQRLTGALDKAHATLLLSVDIADGSKEPRSKAWALSDCAALAANLKKNEFARLLFDRATKSLPAVNDSDDLQLESKLIVVEHIVATQANIGFIDDARKTASTIRQGESDSTRGRYREAALYAIAVAQARAGDVDGAVNTALSLKSYEGYRDGALNDAVELQIGKRDWKAALATTEKFDNPSRKAVATLRVASAQAKAGDREAAGKIAAQIKLTHRSELHNLPNADDKGFDYRRPQSWGECYEPYFTTSSRIISVRRATEVAAAAMELALAIEYKPDLSYFDLFNDVNTEEVVQSLARAHATFGDPKEAVAWARKIGSGDKVPEKDRDRVSGAVQRRIHALLGVAEGILNRSKR